MIPISVVTTETTTDLDSNVHVTGDSDAQRGNANERLSPVEEDANE